MPEPLVSHTTHSSSVTEIDDFRLPKRSSLVVIILANVLLQISFFIVVSSSNAYSEYLGGTSTFSGLVIGIPTAFSALTLIPMTRLDGGGYRRPLLFSSASSIAGFVLYGLAYKANFLYLILLGRIVAGLSFTMWMYAKRYCSDARLVGIRRRTTLAGWLVVGQGMGLSAGPFLGGLLYKVGFENDIFNGFTSPAWVMVAVWMSFTALATIAYEEAPRGSPLVSSVPAAPARAPTGTSVELDELSATGQALESRHISIHSSSAQQRRFLHLPSKLRLSVPQMPAGVGRAELGVGFCMCWHAMTCFFILGGWEANLPVYGAASDFAWSPFEAGNFIALGGVATFPFLFLNLFLARRIQDRIILATGTGLGLTGLLITVALLKTNTVTFGSLFVCWFLVALGFNISSTVTLSLLSKHLPNEWNGITSLFIQYSNYLGRVTGAVWGGSGVKVGMLSYIGLQIAVVGLGGLMFLLLWKNLKAKTG